ncbi:MAG: hypothetical protein L0287_19800 [Anaerolineae bacterium]|nr:hypothetical protein [Anaerolineae bacterium]
MRIARAFIVFFIIAASILFNARQAQAQSGVVLENVGASVRFGEGITFIATIKAPIQIQNASIIIFDEAQGLTHVQPVAIREDGTAEYLFDTRQNTLRPFSVVRWSYQIALADGSTFQSETYFIRYDDDRFAWQTLEAGSVRVHWYNGDANFGQAALNAAQSGLGSISKVMPLDLTQPVEIFIYANATDLRGTLYPESSEWVAGHANSAIGVVMVMIEPGPNQSIFMEQRIPHELMHVMLYRRIGAGYNNLPAWLREGVATLTEINPNPDYDVVLASAGVTDTLIPIKDLCASFSPNPDAAFLAYAEAQSFTNYLHDTYGSQSLLNLALAYADGVDCERGTESAYGISLSKLEMDWRRSALGQNPVLPALQNMFPYLALLCVILLIPFIGIMNVLRKKGNRNEPESYA